METKMTKTRNMIKRLFALAMMMTCAIGAWADVTITSRTATNELFRLERQGDHAIYFISGGSFLKSSDLGVAYTGDGSELTNTWQINADDRYIGFTLPTELSFQEGDIITITGGLKSAGTSKGFKLKDAASEATFEQTVNLLDGYTAYKKTTLSYTIQAGDGIIGKSSLYIYRNGENAYVEKVVVTRTDADDLVPNAVSKKTWDFATVFSSTSDNSSFSSSIVNDNLYYAKSTNVKKSSSSKYPRFTAPVDNNLDFTSMTNGIAFMLAAGKGVVTVYQTESNTPKFYTKSGASATQLTSLTAGAKDETTGFTPHYYTYDTSYDMPFSVVRGGGNTYVAKIVVAPESVTTPTIENTATNEYTVTPGTSNAGPAVTVTTYYTTDGRTPTSSSTVLPNDGKISVTSEMTAINVLSISSFDAQSQVATQEVSYIAENVTAPTIRNNSGTITITPGTSSFEASVNTYYTTDGNDPTALSTEYTAPFSYPEACTQIKAITISQSTQNSLSEVATKTVPAIPTALAANSLNFANLATSSVVMDDASNFNTENENKYITTSTNASSIYVNGVTFSYSTDNAELFIRTQCIQGNKEGASITIPGLSVGQIVYAKVAGTHESNQTSYNCTGGEFITNNSPVAKLKYEEASDLLITATGSSITLTNSGQGFRLFRLALANTMTVAVADGQTEMGTAVISTPTVPTTATITDAALGNDYYVKGSSVTVTASPVEGYYFVNWTNGSGEAVSSDATYTFELNDNLALTANFAAKTAPTVEGLAAASLTYNGSAQNLVTTPTVTGGTIKYSTTSADTEDFSETIPQSTDAGTYNVWYKVEGDAAHTDIAASDENKIEVTIAKATLALDGTLTATATYGTKLSEINNFTGTVKIANTETVVAGTWAIVVQGEDAVLSVGSYETYTALFTPTQAEGKDNFYALGAQSVSTLTITKADVTLTAPTGATGLTYNGSAQQIVNAANAACTGGELQYCKTADGEYTTNASTITETDAGTYSFYYKVVADGNHTDIAPVEVTGIEIAKFNISNATASAIDDQTYTGSQIKPDAPAIKMNENEEIATSNYTVAYGDNIAAGNNAGSITYTATNESTNFTGTKTLTFNIIGADLTFSGTLSATANYGTKVKDITLTAEGDVTFGETVIAGSWTFSESDNDVLQVGNTTAKTATFHPTENAGNYNAMTREVTPAITAIALTIKAKDQEIWEGETISQDVSQVEVTGLVEGETLTSITLTASTTEITSDGTITPSNAVISSSAGNYNIDYQTGKLTIKQIPTYTITGVAADGNGNSVTANAGSAREGATITLTITTAEGYTLTSISATGATLSGTGNTRTFTMPAANVTISATFAQTSAIDETTQITENITKTDENHAKVTSVEIGASTTSVTISGSADGVPITSIAEGTFTSTNTANVQSIDLSKTQVALTGERTANTVLKDIPENTLVYLPSSSSVTGNNVIIYDGEGSAATDYTCSSFVMADEKSYSIPKEFTATSATLNRTFTESKTCTVCLPYGLTAEDANSAGSFYSFSSVNGNKVIMTQKTGGLVANMPYIFVPNSDTGNNNKFAASNVTVSMSNDPKAENTGFTFKGVYSKKTFTQDEINSGVYGFAAGDGYGANIGQFVKGSLGTWVEGMRAYLEYNGTLNEAGTASTRSSNLPDVLTLVLMNANGTTTDIGRLELMTAEDGSAVYNLKGQRVDSSYKGMVIKNGKKVVIK